MTIIRLLNALLFAVGPLLLAASMLSKNVSMTRWWLNVAFRIVAALAFLIWVTSLLRNDPIGALIESVFMFLLGVSAGVATYAEYVLIQYEEIPFD